MKKNGVGYLLHEEGGKKKNVKHTILKLSCKKYRNCRISFSYVIQKNERCLYVCCTCTVVCIRWRASEVAAFGKRSNGELGRRLFLSQVLWTLSLSGSTYQRFLMFQFIQTTSHGEDPLSFLPLHKPRSKESKNFSKKRRCFLFRNSKYREPIYGLIPVCGGINHWHDAWAGKRDSLEQI
jgi:hypothetical protein